MALVTAVIGAGRMGSFFASQLPQGNPPLVYSRTPESARRLADRVSGRACESIDELARADLIAVAVPATEVGAVLEALLEVVRDGSIVLNMATAARIPESSRRRRPSVHLIETKVIGHARFLALGMTGLVVTDCRNDAVLGLIREHLTGFGPVVAGDAGLVEKVNRICSRAAVGAVATARRALAAARVPEDWVGAAIGNVCSGTVRAVAEDDVGHFLRGVLEEMEGRRPADSDPDRPA